MQVETIMSHRADSTKAFSKMALMESGIGMNDVVGSMTTDRDSMARAASARTPKAPSLPKCGASIRSAGSPRSWACAPIHQQAASGKHIIIR